MVFAIAAVVSCQVNFVGVGGFRIMLESFAIACNLIFLISRFSAGIPTDPLDQTD